MAISGEPLEEPVLTGLILERGLTRNPNQPALVSMTETRTWRQLEETVATLADSYARLGLKAGDRVASLMPNRASLLIHYLACLKAGFVSVPLNYRYMAPEIDYALELSEASLLLAHSERIDELKRSDRARELPIGCVCYREKGDDGFDATAYFDQLINPKNTPSSLRPPESGSPAVIFFTSGSTGKPKGVTHTHETLGWILASMIKSYRLTSDDVLMPATSFSHLGGFVFSLVGLAVGARVEIVRDIADGELIRILRTRRPTALKILPAALDGLVNDPDVTHDDFASLRLCISGGDKVAGDLEDSFKQLSGVDLSEIYGMTETGAATCDPPGAEFRRGSIGRPGAGYTISVRDENGSEVPTGTQGRCWIGFPGVSVGYWENPEATAAAIFDGEVDTGDIVSVDEEGYFWFHGRRKQIIVHDGSNVCPQEVEEAVRCHPAVALACAVGIRHPIHGENVRAYVTLRRGATRPPLSQIIAQARKQIGYKAPEEIVVLDKMPIMVSGKIDREQLKRMAAGDA